MRHRYSGRKFGRTASHRKAMFQNMTNSLVEHEVIKTALRGGADHLKEFLAVWESNK